MERVELTVEFEMETYIAHPYWPETNDVIDIQKKSGMNRVKSDEKREKALKGYLDSIGLTLTDYERLIERSKRQWYRADNDDQKSLIVIPRHHVSACLVETSKTAPASVRGKYKPDSLRHHIQISNFDTDRSTKDGVFQRYVKLETSNQRSLQCNELIGINPMTGEGKPFVAKGRFFVEPDTMKPQQLEALKRFVSHALQETGIGASRKMGCGRGKLVSMENGNH